VKGVVVKTNKAIKRLTHVEDLLSDVMERYSPSASDIREDLQSAKAAVGRVKDAVKLQVPSGTKSVQKKAATKKAAVKVAPAKARKKHGTTRRDYEG
jgi:hypothetical protein